MLNGCKIYKYPRGLEGLQLVSYCALKDIRGLLESSKPSCGWEWLPAHRSPGVSGSCCRRVHGCVLSLLTWLHSAACGFLLLPQAFCTRMIHKWMWNSRHAQVVPWFINGVRVKLSIFKTRGRVELIVPLTHTRLSLSVRSEHKLYF